VRLTKVNNKWVYYASDFPEDDIVFDPDMLSKHRIPCSATISTDPFAMTSEGHGPDQ
jgi:hypothetical protein